MTLGLAAGLLASGAMAQTSPPTQTPPPAQTAPAAPSAPSTQSAPPTRIRGTIASLKGQMLTINTRDGSKVDVSLNDPLTVTTVKRLKLADIKEGSYVGVASKTGADGSAQALEVLVFPDSMRGVGEGHYAWDLQPGSMMTNANVTAVVKAKAGNDLTLTYKDGTQKITVPANTPIVTFAPAERSDLKPGARVMFGATKSADGKLTASRITVATHGVNPPM
jgi:hypothetical protein